MAFIHDDQVIEVHGRHVLWRFSEEDALHQGLDRADMHLGGFVRRDLVQPLKAEGVGEGVGADDARGAELAARLVAKRGAIHHEADAPEASGR